MNRNPNKKCRPSCCYMVCDAMPCCYFPPACTWSPVIHAHKYSTPTTHSSRQAVPTLSRHYDRSSSKAAAEEVRSRPNGNKIDPGPPGHQQRPSSTDHSFVVGSSSSSSFSSSFSSSSSIMSWLQQEEEEGRGDDRRY